MAGHESASSGGQGLNRYFSWSKLLPQPARSAHLAMLDESNHITWKLRATHATTPFRLAYSYIFHLADKLLANARERSLFIKWPLRGASLLLLLFALPPMVISLVLFGVMAGLKAPVLSLYWLSDNIINHRKSGEYVYQNTFVKWLRPFFLLLNVLHLPGERLDRALMDSDQHPQGYNRTTKRPLLRYLKGSSKSLAALPFNLLATLIATAITLPVLLVWSGVAGVAQLCHRSDGTIAPDTLASTSQGGSSSSSLLSTGRGVTPQLDSSASSKLSTSPDVSSRKPSQKLKKS